MKKPILILFILIIATLANAHQPGNSNLDLTLNSDGTLSGEFHVANVDFESINLMLEDRLRNISGNDNVAFDSETEGVRALAWITMISNKKPVTFITSSPQIVTTENGPHTMVPFKTSPIVESDLEITFSNYFSFDPQHMVNVELDLGEESKIGIINLDHQTWTPSESAFEQFIVFTIEGVWHIWIGIDHILFLIALLLPSVLALRNGKWMPVGNFKDAFKNVLKVVTAFTVAHSVTLTLATLDIVTLPSKWVEVVIAISVVLAALNNIFPKVSDKVWMVAFGFGLIHGFGFASVLGDLNLPTGTLAVALLSFNIGVEIGQMAIVVAFFPIIFALRKHSFYQPIKLRLGSVVIALIACGWIVDRIWELEMMPF